MTIKEGDRVRLTADTQGIRGSEIPAGTIGTVVDDMHAPDQYAVDVKVNDRYDNVAVSGEQIEAVAD
jgi:hypothetical protein